jgi:rapamycin-insensitive companion of mTOR
MHLQTLPHVFSMASHFDDAKDRFQSTSLLQNIDKYNRLQARQLKVLQAIQNTRARANSLEDPLSRGQRHVENSKIKMGMQIDDVAWKNLLLESQVLLTKEYQKWNYDAILEAVEGPLLNPARLNEVIKGTKFLRRVITFFHPFERCYSDLDNSPVSVC